MVSSGYSFDAAGSAASWSVMLLAVQLIGRSREGEADGAVDAAGRAAFVYCRRLLLMPLAEQLLSTAGGAAIVNAAGGAAYWQPIIIANIVPPTGILPQASLSTQRHMGALYKRISENYRASYRGEVEVGADTRAFRRFRATRDGTIHEDRYTFAV
ncbi:uncharacterized protein BDR25DRAFT_350376 [Lindgomyces ingoldianus]|uniref:Uncharacterized protein n=1 Tax=Lindgomyces ingoldianus TaxID=673940 RepID=A0ACB6R9Y1_9PLEO|nr:uncharacterized protein BDR25DRAFT_350376 [Lindgomyces ingoldianus]KAF2476083.1 hypothetical protein BDR25DRAFT_350376 [Lindgomyces ingoldianus]